MFIDVNYKGFMRSPLNIPVISVDDLNEHIAILMRDAQVESFTVYKA